VNDIKDEFLSDEDLDLRNLNEKELSDYWNQWLEQAQATNSVDEHTYSHGVFVREPEVRRVIRVAEQGAAYKAIVPTASERHPG
jgi:hypothetical protein